MHKHTTMTTGRASLCALGEYLRRHCFFAPLREHVQIRQKTVRYRPIDKLLDALSGMLCGAKTIAQNNLTIRTDRACNGPLGGPAVPSSPPSRGPCGPVRRRMLRSLTRRRGTI